MDIFLYDCIKLKFVTENYRHDKAHSKFSKICEYFKRHLQWNSHSLYEQSKTKQKTTSLIGREVVEVVENLSNSVCRELVEPHFWIS